MKHHAIKIYRGMEVCLHAFLTLALINVSGQLYLQEKSPWYLLDRRLGRPQSQSGHGGKEETSLTCQEFNSSYSP
jgi:hypothetical protein